MAEQKGAGSRDIAHPKHYNQQVYQDKKKLHATRCCASPPRQLAGSGA